MLLDVAPLVTLQSSVRATRLSSTGVAAKGCKIEQCSVCGATQPRVPRLSLPCLSSGALDKVMAKGLPLHPRLRRYRSAGRLPCLKRKLCLPSTYCSSPSSLTTLTTPATCVGCNFPEMLLTTNLGRLARSITGCQWRWLHPTRTLSTSTGAASIGKRDLPARPRDLPFNHEESQVIRTAMQELHRQNKEINELERLLEKFRIASLPVQGHAPRRRPQHELLRVATLPGNSDTATSTQNQEMQHTFQVMNRNARKPKRANHGKRPCSRIRRRYKVKKWANTSRGRG